MYDLVVRDGKIVDGSGTPGHIADLGVVDGRIADIAPRLGPARRVIDATGRVVAPGFVDVHTHIDAQLFWDPTLSPLPLHGVTTVFAGNCGFSLAPLPSTQADYVRRMLAGVEGMPLTALEVGVPWGTWESTAEYLDLVEGAISLNAGFLVGHSTLRRAVMGEAGTQRPATPEETAEMADLLRAGLDAGALGFSSSWASAHHDGDGRPVPSRFAEVDELVALSSVLAEFPGTSIEFLPGIGQFGASEFDVSVRMTEAAGRPLNWNALDATADTLHEALHNLIAGDLARLRGGKIVALATPVAPPLRISFASPFILQSFAGLGRGDGPAARRAAPPLRRSGRARPARRSRAVGQSTGPIRSLG